jgi:3-deoxy-D-manno-octulosonic acid kinase
VAEVLRQDRIWGAAPDGFEKIEADRRRRLLVRADVAREIEAEMRGVEQEMGDLSAFHGRVRLRTVRLRNGENALIRAYRHGGLFQALTGSTYMSRPPRPFRELAVTEELRRRGVPTVEVYGACVQSVLGPFYRGWLITRELKGSYDLWTALQNGFVRQWTAEQVLRPVARSLRSLHRQGVYHSDLNLKNILVRAESGAVRGYIIDFDGAKLFLGALPKPFAEQNLRRLLRSVYKLDPRREYLSSADWDRFMTWYHEAEKQ